MLRAALMSLVLSLPAQAGPWLREEGGTYLSFTAEIAEYDEMQGWLSVYGERGIRPWVTLGIDAGGRHDGTAAKALVFARLPIIGEGDWRMAAHLGAGAWLDDGEVAPVIRPGLSVGRGLDLWEGGWWAADLNASIDAAGGTHLDLDGVLGLRPGWGGALLMGLRASDEGVRLVPGYERPVGPALVAVSAVLDPEGEAPPALSLRTALEF